MDAITKEQLDFIETYAEVSSTETKYDNAFKAWIEKHYPEITSEEDTNAKRKELVEIFTTVYLPLYADAYNGTTLALVEIGYYSRSALKTFGDVTEETPEEGEGTEGEETTPETPETPEEPGEDTTLPGDYASYYEFVIEAKFQTPYYAQFGTNG